MNSQEQPPAPPSQPEIALGDILRKAREAAGLDLDTLSEELRITKSHLRALEDGEYQKLPAFPYVRAWIAKPPCLLF
jgi:cytoskeletal protein RodZ